MKWSDMPPWIQAIMAILFVFVGGTCMAVFLLSVFGEPGNG